MAKKGRSSEELLNRLEDRHAEVLSRLDDLEAQVEQALDQVGRAARGPDVVPVTAIGANVDAA